MNFNIPPPKLWGIKLTELKKRLEVINYNWPARSTIVMETEGLVLTTPSLLWSLISICERASIFPACAFILIPRGASMLKDRVGDSSLQAGNLTVAHSHMVLYFWKISELWTSTRRILPKVTYKMQLLSSSGRLQKGGDYLKTAKFPKWEI